MSCVVTTEDVNCLVYQYLVDSGFVHASFALKAETPSTLENLKYVQIPRGELVLLLRRALLYLEVEETWLSQSNGSRSSVPQTLLHRYQLPSLRHPQQQPLPSQLLQQSELPASLRPSYNQIRQPTPLQPSPQPTQPKPIQTMPPPPSAVPGEKRKGEENRPYDGMRPEKKARIEDIPVPKSLNTVPKLTEIDKVPVINGTGTGPQKVVPPPMSPSSTSPPKLPVRAPESNPLPAPIIPAPTIPAPTIPAPTIPAPTIPAPTIPTPTIPAPAPPVNGSAAESQLVLPNQQSRIRSDPHLPPATPSKVRSVSVPRTASRSPSVSIPPSSKSEQNSLPGVTIAQGHGSSVYCAAWHPTDPELLATGSADGTVLLWKVHRDTATHRHEYTIISTLAYPSSPLKQSAEDTDGEPEPESDVAQLHWHPTRSILAANYQDGFVRLWSKEGELLSELSGGEAVWWSGWADNGNTLVTASAEAAAVAWDVRDARNPLVKRRIETDAEDRPGHQIALIPSTSRLVTRGDDFSLSIVDMDADESDPPVASLVHHTNDIRCLQVGKSPEGLLLASGSDDLSVAVWRLQPFVDRQMGDQGRDIIPKWRLGVGGGNGAAHASGVTEVRWGAFQKDVWYLASTSVEDASLCMWNARDGSLLYRLSPIMHSPTLSPEPRLYSQSFDPSMKLICTTGVGFFSIFEVESGKLVWTWSSPDSFAADISWQSDGWSIAVPQDDRTVVLIDIEGLESPKMQKHCKALVTGRS